MTSKDYGQGALEREKREILGALRKQREDAEEAPAAIREVELVPSETPEDLYWKALRDLSRKGTIKRSGGYVWITEGAFYALEIASD